jgi:hypothetical protein
MDSVLAWLGNNIEAVGSTCLGLVLGAIAGCFFGEAKKLTWNVLVGTVGILAGASVIAIFQMLSTYAPPGRAIWFYPIGLLPGFLFGVYALAYPPEE